MSALAFVAHPQRAWWRRIVALAAQALARFGSALAAERRRRLGIRQLQDLDGRLLARHQHEPRRDRIRRSYRSHGIVNRPVPQVTARGPAAPHAPPLMRAQSLSPETSPKR
jgi:hypothetical protein